MSSNTSRCSCDIALGGRLGLAYNEEAFRYLLKTEQRRAKRARRSLVLLLIKVKEQPGSRGGVSRMTASRIFSGLWLSVREIDFVGWFRQERIAGAVLAVGARPLSTHALREIRQRVIETVRERVSSRIVRDLDVRLVQLRSGRRN